MPHNTVLAEENLMDMFLHKLCISDDALKPIGVSIWCPCYHSTHSSQIWNQAEEMKCAQNIAWYLYEENKGMES